MVKLLKWYVRRNHSRGGMGPLSDERGVIWDVDLTSTWPTGNPEAPATVVEKKKPLSYLRRTNKGYY